MNPFPSPARILTRQNVVMSGPVELVEIGGAPFLKVGVNGAASWVAPGEVASITPLAGRPATLYGLLESVSEVFGKPVKAITSQAKPVELAEARFAFWLVAFERRMGTTGELSRAAGRKNPGASAYGRHRGRELCDMDPRFRAKVDAVRALSNQ